MRALGLSRDAASLAWTARSLRLAGKKAAAIRLYREALRIAGRPDPAMDPEPVFDDDPAVRRYLLPGEAAAAAVVRELFVDAAWTFQEWSEAVPPDTIALLATARLFREQGRPEAETLIAQSSRTGEGARSGRSRARHPARRRRRGPCVALPLERGRGAYRLAIEAMDDAVVKRSWWFNLASIAHRLDDETQRPGRARGGPGRPRERRHQPACDRVPAGLRAPGPAAIRRDEGQLNAIHGQESPSDPKDEQPWRRPTTNPA